MAEPSLSSELFGSLPKEDSVESWTIAGSGGSIAEIITYGGIVRRLLAPGRDGQFTDVFLGFNQLQTYLEDRANFGAIFGRVAGRISGSQVHVEGRIHELSANKGTNHLHGGYEGFNRKLWMAAPFVEAQNRPSLRLEYLSQDGEESYLGSAHVSFVYTVTPDNCLLIRSKAISDRTTPFSFTYHLLFQSRRRRCGIDCAT